ncbi:hypothetical protein ANRL4_01822 [Anaerolineae bacterium]|nr:hypothetical protein ANRL4_01822 [Anaerolineae bacterium]
MGIAVGRGVRVGARVTKWGTVALILFTVARMVLVNVGVAVFVAVVVNVSGIGVNVGASVAVVALSTIGADFVGTSIMVLT